MTDQLNGLLTVKPANKPNAGDTLHLLKETRTSEKSGKEYLKFKRDREGPPYRILTATQTDYSDDHGNISFSISVEPFGDSETPVEGAVSPPNASNVRSGTTNRDEEIARAVAFKGAIELTAAMEFGPDIDKLVNWVGNLTTALLPIVKGETNPPTKSDPDEEIPF